MPIRDFRLHTELPTPLLRHPQSLFPPIWGFRARIHPLHYAIFDPTIFLILHVNAYPNFPLWDGLFGMRPVLRSVQKKKDNPS
ncbi:hypothetical protein J3R74_001088 [Puniceicoccus vermicola]